MRLSLPLAIACALASSALAPAIAKTPADGAEKLAAAVKAMPQGYLKAPALPESADWTPAPPAADTPSGARDRAGAEAGVALRGSPRWDLAVRDADLTGGGGLAAFDCTLGIALGPKATPKTYALLRRTMMDFGMSTSVVKKKYMRERPFMENNQPSCTPDWEAALRKDGSYPSGHSAIGFGTALVLAELDPDRAAAIIARGRAFGDSRRVCNVHWLSDIEEGRIFASTTFARLQSEPKFRKDMEAARRELHRARANPTGCDVESGALALTR